MVPLVSVPEKIRCGLAPYRDVFCRAEGFEHISRYVTCLLLSPYKTLQEIYDLQVWYPESPHSPLAMHEAVFEALGCPAPDASPSCCALLCASPLRTVVIILYWNCTHIERGLKIWGVKKASDHVAERLVPYHSV